MTIATALEPHLTPMLTHLSDWVSGHGPDIGQTFDHLGKAIEGVHWADVGTQVERVGSDVAAVVKHLEDFGARMDRVTTNVGNFIHLVQTPGRVFYDALQRGGDIPQVDDMGRPIKGAGRVAAPRRHRHFSGDQGQSLGPSAPAPVSREQEERAVRGRDILTGLGWSPEPAAGIMANVHAESKMNEGAAGDGGQAYGVAQWHPDRREAIRNGTGRSVVGMSFDDQIRAIDWELKHNEKAAGDRLQQAKTAAEAGDIVSRQYERPRAADADASVRAQTADGFDRRWKASKPGAPSSPQLTMPGTDRVEPSASAERADRTRAELSDFLQSQIRSQQSTVQIDINHNGAPNGVTMDAKATGAAEVGKIRVARAMPDSDGRRDRY